MRVDRRWMPGMLTLAAVVVASVGCSDAPRGSPDGSVPADASTDGPGADAGPGTDGGPGTDATSPGGDLVDPACVDGMYSETLPSPDADIGDLVSGYDSAAAEEFLLGVLDRRYTIGAYIVENAPSSSIDCVDTFLRDTSSADGVLQSAGTVVHECGHVLDNSESPFDGSAYIIRPDLRFDCSMGDTTSRGGQTFARSRIRDDEFASSYPPCDGGGPTGCDSYAGIYLDGDPDDGTFDGGDQGFNSLLEETVQYVNSLATGYALNDIYEGRFTSARDGILTFLWYLERYLRMARLDYPDAYDHISGDSCWRDAILTTWGRAWLFLETTADLPQLGIDDDAIRALVTSDDLLSEIERLRTAAGCP